MYNIWFGHQRDVQSHLFTHRGKCIATAKQLLALCILPRHLRTENLTGAKSIPWRNLLHSFIKDILIWRHRKQYSYHNNLVKFWLAYLNCLQNDIYISHFEYREVTKSLTYRGVRLLCADWLIVVLIDQSESLNIKP